MCSDHGRRTPDPDDCATAAVELAFSAGLDGLEHGEHAPALEALMQFAAIRGDVEAEAEWARRGAAVGSSRCAVRHGHLLALSADGDVDALRAALAVVERGLTAQDADSFFVAGLVALAAQEEQRATLWLTRAARCGHRRASGVMKDHGL